MGKRERRDSEKVLAGKKILDIKTSKWYEILLEPFLYPYRIWKNKRREAQIRKNLFKD